MKIYDEKILFDKRTFPYYELFSEDNLSRITMENDRGLKIEFLNYGGIITKIQLPDKNNQLQNIVVALDEPTDYFNNPSYLGAIIGRTSGRVAHGSFHLKNQTYDLNKNFGVTSCHGGNIGFDKRFMSYYIRKEEQLVSCVFTYTSPHMEEGYPGNIDITIVYSLDQDNNFKFQMVGKGDETTLLNITNHSYFNLSGDLTKSVLDTTLMIEAPFYLGILPDGVPNGEHIATRETPFDFNQPKNLGAHIKDSDPQIALGKGYDHYFILDKKKQPALVASDDRTGIQIDVTTDYDGVVLYSQNSPIQLTKNMLLPRHSFAMEFQQPPIGDDGAFQEASVLPAGETYDHFIQFHLEVQ